MRRAFSLKEAMARTVQAVFLVDIASLHSYDDNLITPDFEKSVRAIRYCCLKFLTYFGTHKTRWGFKFYCSSGLTRQRMEKRPFSEHNLENFEDFEDALTQRLERYRAACEAVDRTWSSAKDPPCVVMRTALTQVASEFQWDAPDIASPVKLAKRRRLDAFEDRVTNCVFCISRSPTCYRDLDVFLGKPHRNADIAAELMPAELRRLFLATLNARLIWIDTASVSPQVSDFRLAIQKLNGIVVPISLAVTTLPGAFQANPFSSVAKFCLGKYTRRTLPVNATTVIRGEETLCRVALCFDSVASSSMQNCWEEIHITYKTQKTCVVNSERVLGFTADTPRGLPLRSLLADLSCHGEGLAVELRSESLCNGILFPVTDQSFCVHIVAVPPLHLEEPAPNCKGGESIAKSFDPTVLEEWFVPSASASSFLTSFCQKEPSSQERDFLLDKIQKCYVPNYSSSKRDVRPKSDQVRKKPSGSCNLRKALSLNIASRSAGMVASSYVDHGCTETSTSAGQGEEARQPRLPDGEACDEAQLVERLRSTLESAASSEQTSAPVTCAQNVVAIVKHHVNSKRDAGEGSTSAEELLEKYFAKNCAQIAQTYPDPKDPLNGRRRLHEYRFQVALALERELQFKTLPSTCVETVLSLLRTMSFVYGPSTANRFLVGPIKDEYVVSLREVLVEICEELDVPLFRDDSAPSDGAWSDSESRDITEPSVDSATSRDSYLSSVPSVCSQRVADENRQTARMDLLQASALEKRQIVVPRAVGNQAKATKRTRTLPTAPLKKEGANNVRRGLFVSPAKKSSDVKTPRKRLVLKTTFVPETPTYKQGDRVVLRRQERLRKRSGVTATVSVVEETPEKLLKGKESVTPRKPPGNRSDRPLMSATTETTLMSKRPRARLSYSTSIVTVTETPLNLSHNDRTRTPTRPTLSPFSPGKHNLERAALSENVCTTPQRRLRDVFSVAGTPSNRSGSDALFVSPTTVSPGDASDSSPRKCVEFATTSRKRVSKRLLGSPSTPRMKRTFNEMPSGPRSPDVNSARPSFRLQSPEADVPKLPGSRPMSLSPDGSISRKSEHAIEDSSHPGIRRSLRRRVQERSSDNCGEHATPEPLASITTRALFAEAGAVAPKPPNGRSGLASRMQGSGILECTEGSGAESPPHLESRLSLSKTKERYLSSYEHKGSETHKCAVKNLTPPTHGPARITRSKTKETGLTSYEIFLLSQISPVKGTNEIKEDRRRAEDLKTPLSAPPRKKTFASPSAFSVLRLTTSPIFSKD